MSSIRFDDLDASLGDYCRENEDFLRLQLFDSIDIMGHVDVYTDVKDEKPLIVPNISDVVQTGDPTTFNPTNNAFGWDASILKVRPFKVDLQIIPQQLHSKYLAKLFKAGSDPYAYPFEQFLFDYIISKGKENILDIIFKGIYVPGPAGTGVVNTLNVNTGFLKWIEDAITATQLTPVTTGVIDATNAVSSLESVWNALPDKLKKSGAKMYISPSIREFYNLDYRNRYGTLNYNQGFAKTMLEASDDKCQLVTTRGLSNSQRVICDPVGVLAVGTDLESDYDNIIVEKEKRAINIMMDGKIGTGIAAFTFDGMEYLSVNDQA